MFRFFLLVAFLFVACVPPTNGANCHVQAVQSVVVPTVQQIIAVPVQPYYFSYTGQVSSGNNQAIKPTTERDYLTKQEFLEAMKLMLAESRGDTQYITENNPEEVKLRELVNNRCMSCHQNPTGKWPKTDIPVTFFDANGKWDANINWDRMVTVTIGGKMPKGGPRLTADECQLFIKKAEKMSAVPAPPPPQAQPQTQPIPGNY